MIFSDMKDDITIYTVTRNPDTAFGVNGRDEHIRMYLSKVFFQPTQAQKLISGATVSTSNYICLIPYSFVDAHGRQYIPFYEYDTLPIQERRERYWTLKTGARVFMGLIDEPEVLQIARITLVSLQTKYTGRNFSLRDFDNYLNGSPQIHHAAIGGV